MLHLYCFFMPGCLSVLCSIFIIIISSVMLINVFFFFCNDQHENKCMMSDRSSEWLSSETPVLVHSDSPFFIWTLFASKLKAFGPTAANQASVMMNSVKVWQETKFLWLIPWLCQPCVCVHVVLICWIKLFYIDWQCAQPQNQSVFTQVNTPWLWIEQVKRSKPWIGSLVLV